MIISIIEQGLLVNSEGSLHLGSLWVNFPKLLNQKSTSCFIKSPPVALCPISSIWSICFHVPKYPLCTAYVLSCGIKYQRDSFPPNSGVSFYSQKSMTNHSEIMSSADIPELFLFVYWGTLRNSTFAWSAEIKRVFYVLSEFNSAESPQYNTISIQNICQKLVLEYFIYIYFFHSCHHYLEALYHASEALEPHARAMLYLGLRANPSVCCTGWLRNLAEYFVQGQN